MHSQVEQLTQTNAVLEDRVAELMEKLEKAEEKERAAKQARGSRRLGEGGGAIDEEAEQMLFTHETILEVPEGKPATRDPTGAHHVIAV